MTAKSYRPPKRTWFRKFADAFAGLRVGVQGQSSFTVHAIATLGVIAAAAGLQMGSVQWSLLILCISGVWSAELMNRAIEILAPAIDDKENQRLADGLNVASASVLTASLGSVIVGAIVFGCRVIQMWQIQP